MRCSDGFGLRRYVLLCILAVAAFSPQTGSAQFDLLQSLLGRKKAVTATFQGQAQLSQAREAAEQGHLAESLKLARQAMQTVTTALPPGDPTTQMVTRQLLDLSQIWSQKQAAADQVTAVLTDIVLPARSPGEVRLYALPWQANFQPWNVVYSTVREPRPQSVAAELVDWSVRASGVKSLRTALEPALQATPPSSAALVLAVQLAIADKDHAGANRRLSELAAVSESLDDGGTLEGHLHAVAAAILDDATQANGLSLLDKTLSRLTMVSTQTDMGLATSAASLRLHAARLHVDAGRIEDGVRLALAAAAHPVNGQSYGEELAVHMGRLQTLQAALVLLDAGRVSDSLDLLGPLADVPEPRYAMYYPGPNVVAMLGRELNRLPAQERYDLLHKWTLPGGERSTIRDLTDFVPGDPSPMSAESLVAAGVLHDVYSTGWDLLRTARELNQLDGVLSQLAAVPQQTPQTQTLLTLGAILRHEEAIRPDAQPVAPLAADRLTTLIAATAANIPKWEDQQKAPYPMLAYVVAAEAAKHPRWNALTLPLLERLIEHSQRLQWDRPRNHARMTWAEVLRRQGDDASLDEGSGIAVVPQVWTGLRPPLWTASGIQTASQHASGALPDVWVAQDGYIQHVAGTHDSDLFFQYPLAGEFEITLEAREGAWSEGCVGYGGTLFAISAHVDQAILRSPGRSGYRSGPQLPNLLHKSPWNQYRIQVSPGVVRFLANGQLIHEDQPGLSSPWFSLGADWGRTPIFRNMQLTGTPIVPREVPLLTDVRLRGWVAEYYGESRRDPLGPLPGSVVDPNGDAQNAGFLLVDGVARALMEPITDWSFRDGELQSPVRENFWPGVAESWLSYHRPLHAGETVRYEFYYRAGEIDAHPTVGRRAFVLQPEGLTTRWLTDGERDVRGLKADNGVIQNQPLPLQSDAWNTIEVVMRDEAVEIHLNGKMICSQPLDAAESRTFGFYHDASRTSLRVRNANLRGDWPASFDEALRRAIESPQPSEAPPDRQFLTAVMSEPFFSDNAYAVYRRALGLDAIARYDYLYQWVMPGPTHRHLRMAGAFTPAHPAPPTLIDNPIDVAMAEARQSVDQRRIQTGGNFVCPAILLVLSAAELNRVEELWDTVFALDPASSPELARARAAMLGIMALLQDRPAEALDAIWVCHQHLLEPAEQEQHIRWCEPALCSLAILHPATQDAAYALLDRIQGRQLQSGKPGDPDFWRFIRQLHGHVHYLIHGGNPVTLGAQPQLTQWRAVSQSSARANGAGYPLASFDAMSGELALRGGHDFDMAYFQSPLKGNFEVRTRLSQFDYREFMPVVAGISNALKYTHLAVKLQGIHTAIQELPTPQEIAPRVRTWGDYRIVVQDGHYTCYVGDQVVYEADLSPHADPWVALAGWAGGSSRAARNVVITGTPEIPDELHLLAAGDLGGWLPDYYGAAAGQTLYPWKLTDGVLSCEQAVMRNAEAGRLKIENIIRYHRPMLEDGEISYEFYYDPKTQVVVPPDRQRNYPPYNQQRFVPGQALVHPALDRLVCLIEPDGVKVHWLTDGRYDRTGMLPGNVTVEPGRGPKAVPLRPQDWNAVRLLVAGDMLTIFVNDEPVFSRPLEPTNLRQFGLFHYANESSVRVRNVRYRGDWPKALPPVEEQELARGPEQFAVFARDELPARFDYDFANSAFDPTKFAYHWNSQAPKYVHPGKNGLRMTLPAGETKPQTAGVHPKLRIRGDFVATLEYSDLKVLPVKEAWGSGLSFKVMLDQSYESGIEVRQWQKSNGTNVMWQVQTPQKQYLYFSESSTAFPDSGRLRIARRGNVLYFLTAPLDSDEFRLLTQRALSTNDVKAVNFHADCSDQTGMADMIIRSISIQAAELIPVK